MRPEFQRHAGRREISPRTTNYRWAHGGLECACPDKSSKSRLGDIGHRPLSGLPADSAFRLPGPAALKKAPERKLQKQNARKTAIPPSSRLMPCLRIAVCGGIAATNSRQRRSEE